MSTSNSIRHAVRYALLTSAAAAAAGPAYAADTTIQEVVVTGSRIAQPNLETTSPVTQVTAEDIAVQGVTRVEDLINQLPQAFAAQNANVANGATGTATVNLRGLGAPRTLVLIDGRRMPFGGISSASAAADLNQIPAAMVERVEVLTGGASAAYGSDAIGGVVNFIMKKDFEGVQFDAMYGLYQHKNGFSGPGQVKLRDTIATNNQVNPSQFNLPDSNVTDGTAREFNVLMGVSTEDGRGNITAYAGVRDNDKVLQRDRDYSACSLNANPTQSFSCGGSATSFPGYFYSPAGIFTIDQGTGNTFRPFDETTDLYNYGPTNHYQRPDTRYVLGAMGHYELHESADVYTQLMFSEYESVAQIAPGGNFFDTSVINCDNPNLSASQQATLCAGAVDPDATIVGNQAIVPLYIARRNVEGGGRQQRFENTSFRAVLGVRGQISENWDYDTFVQYSTVIADQSANNYFHKTRLNRALDAVDQGAYTGDPTQVGNTVCRSVVDGTDDNCIPWNPFSIGGITPEALNYVQVPGLQQGKIEQEVYSGTITGDLGAYGIQSPLASESIKVAFGVEKRLDRLQNVTDDPSAQNLLSGAGGATIGIDGSTKVLDLFTEVRVPLVQDRTMADQLGLELAYRYSDYDPLTTDTYKVGLDWAPIQDVRFRGSYQRAVRAPNVVELFTSQGFNLFDLPGDPCGADLIGTPGEATRDACLANGVPADVFDRPDGPDAGTQPDGRQRLDSPAGQYNFLQGGSTTLTPEESDTYSYGVVFQPRFAPGLAITLDYFDIQIDNTITTFGPPNTWTACYANNDAAACSRINRNANGQLWVGNGFVQDLNINIGSLSTSGYDVNVGYTGLEIGRFGSLAFNLTGTYLLDLITQPAPGVDLDPGPRVRDWYDCTGFYSSVCLTPSPQWRHRLRASWQTPWDLDLSATWRYYHEVTGITGPNNEMPLDQLDRSLAAENYFDLAANWAITEKANLTLGINNVLDDNPTISGSVGTTGNGNTYPQTYDALGRYVFVRASVEF